MYLPTAGCIQQFFIIAITSNLLNAGTDDSPFLVIDTYYNSYKTELYDRYGDDYTKNKGDIWYYNTTNSPFNGDCITPCEIYNIEFQENGSDGWNFETVFVIAQGDSCSTPIYTVIAADVDVDEWIDENSSDPSQEFYSLNLLNDYCYK